MQRKTAKSVRMSWQKHGRSIQCALTYPGSLVANRTPKTSLLYCQKGITGTFCAFIALCLRLAESICGAPGSAIRPRHMFSHSKRAPENILWHDDKGLDSFIGFMRYHSKRQETLIFYMFFKGKVLVTSWGVEYRWAWGAESNEEPKKKKKETIVLIIKS